MLSHDVACSQPRDERAALLLLREEKAHGETYLSGLYVICAWSCGCAARRRVFRSRAARKAEPYRVALAGRRGAGYGFDTCFDIDLLKSALRNANRGVSVSSPRRGSPRPLGRGRERDTKPTGLTQKNPHVQIEQTTVSQAHDLYL